MLRANAVEHHVEDFDAEVAFFRDVLGCPENMYIANTLAAFKVADNLTVPRAAERSGPSAVHESEGGNARHLR